MPQIVRPGNRVEARCTRCKDITGHVIIVLLEGRIAKVECCACGSIHKYYPLEKQRSQTEPSAGRVKKESSKAAGKPGAVRATETKKQAAVRLAQERWSLAVEKAAGAVVKKYAMDQQIQKGEMVEHPLFGLGCVVEIQRPDKAEIIFQDGVRLLRCRC